MTDETLVKVILDRPGIRSCGKYEAGVVYEVTEAEAARLVSVKKFKLIIEEDNDGTS